MIDRIIAWGREGIALAAEHSAAMNQQAREVRLREAFTRITLWLAEIGHYGAIEFDTGRSDALGIARQRYERATRSYLKTGKLDTLLKAYDEIMATPIPPPVPKPVKPRIMVTFVSQPTDSPDTPAGARSRSLTLQAPDAPP